MDQAWLNSMIRDINKRDILAFLSYLQWIKPYGCVAIACLSLGL